MSSELPPGSRSVAIDVLVHGPQSRAALAKKMGLSAPTLTRIVKPLLEAGVLVEAEAVRTPGRGRSSVPLDVVADAYRFVGMKLTTESIYAVVTDLRATILDTEVVDEPSLDVPDVVAVVAGVIERLQVRSSRQVDAVGVTVGGLVAKGETVAESPFLDWHEVPFRSLIAQETAAEVFLENDVIGLTKAQQWFGHGRTHPSFALLTVGAGVGYGLVVNDEVVRPAGHPVSHFPIDPHGPLCPVGHRGCMTAYVTSPAMVSAVAHALGRSVTYDDVLQLAQDGDPLAARVVDEAAYALGRATSAITSMTGVERIILSGEGVRLAEVGAQALDAGRRAYAVAGFNTPEPIVRRMDFLEWARGAAVIAIQQSFPSTP